MAISSNNEDHPHKNIEDRGIFDSGCSGHMTGNKDHLDDFEECKGGSVTFGGSKDFNVADLLTKAFDGPRHNMDLKMYRSCDEAIGL
ncbi:hypothetical protein Tco_1462877 [Tanacetum coccineum]